jgi:uncharacterized protein
MTTEIISKENAVQSFYNAVESRRSMYGISKEPLLSNERIEEMIRFAVKHAPSAYNSQSGRVAVLFGDNHTKLWDITTETLKKIVPADQFEPTQQRMDAFRNGYATVLFFEDRSIVQSLQDQFPAFAEKFPAYSLQSSGMLQYIVWTSLELEGFGASLQHYNPLIDEEVKKQWNIPDSWELMAQMPFGKPVAGPNEKQFQPVEDRVKFFK